MSLTPPKAPSYNTSNLITGSRITANSDDIFVLDQYRNITYYGDYYTIIKSGNKEYYTGKEPNILKNETYCTVINQTTDVRYTGNYPSSNGDPRPASNIRLFSLKSTGVITSAGALREPKQYDFGALILPEHYYNNAAPRFFARHIKDNTYRETDYTSYVGIQEKKSDFDFKNWEVKTVYKGWQLNFFNYGTFQDRAFSQSTPDGYFHPQSGCYTGNKLKMLAIEKGFVYAPDPSVKPSPLSGIIEPDPNSDTPWPGFCDWYCQKYGESMTHYYSTIQNSDGSYRSNSYFISPKSPIASVNDLNDDSNIIITYYRKDDPKIPLNVRFYVFNKYTQPEVPDVIYVSGSSAPIRGNTVINGSLNKATFEYPSDDVSFLKYCAAVIDDVYVNKDGKELLPSKKEEYKTPKFQFDFIPLFANTTNLSEIYLNESKFKGNPNAKALSVKDNLWKFNNGKYEKYSGPYCVTIQGKYWSGNIYSPGYTPPGYPLKYSLTDPNT